MLGRRRSVLTAFDWFVVVVVIGYLAVVVQAVMRGGTPSLPNTPSSQLLYDGVLPPTKPPEGTSMSVTRDWLGSDSL